MPVPIWDDTNRCWLGEARPDRSGQSNPAAQASAGATGAHNLSQLARGASLASPPSRRSPGTRCKTDPATIHPMPCGSIPPEPPALALRPSNGARSFIQRNADLIFSVSFSVIGAVAAVALSIALTRIGWGL